MLRVGTIQLRVLTSAASPNSNPVFPGSGSPAGVGRVRTNPAPYNTGVNNRILADVGTDMVCTAKRAHRTTNERRLLLLSSVKGRTIAACQRKSHHRQRPFTQVD